jgi:predicted AAA+ superfamily ATPase
MNTKDAERIRDIINFWKNEVVNSKLFPRKVFSLLDIKNPEVIDITGVRRSGKSSVLKLVAQSLPDRDSWLYINFEDPYFSVNNHASILEDIVEIYVKYFSAKLKYLFFDEVQNIDSWERAIRKYRDGSHYKIFITGSSSKLLSGELSTLLTGRHMSLGLMPLSFKEYLSFKGIVVDNEKDLFIKGNELKHMFQDYLFSGGFPQVVLTDQQELLKSYYGDIVEKDIMGRYDVRDKNTLEKIGLFMMSNVSKTLSPTSIKKTYSISFAKAVKYVDYFKEAMLFYELEQYSSSLKSMQRSLKKIYSVDTGMANVVSMSFSEDKGRLLENAVFLELKRRDEQIFYYKTPACEVDFVVRRRNQDKELVQVCWDISNLETRARELKALKKAADNLKLKKATIVTIDQKETVMHEGLKVEIIPAHEWFIAK